MPLWRHAAAMLLMMALAGCGDQPSEAEQDEGFFDQPSWPEYQQTAREFSDDFDPSLTDWAPATPLVNTPEVCESPSETLQYWAEQHNLIGTAEDEALDIDLRTREESEGKATGLLQRWGFRDDALAGTDHRLVLELDDECWEVKEVEYRQYCRRGATDEGLCI